MKIQSNPTDGVPSSEVPSSEVPNNGGTVIDEVDQIVLDISYV